MDYALVMLWSGAAISIASFSFLIIRTRKAKGQCRVCCPEN
jgi:hypothetical protein